MTKLKPCPFCGADGEYLGSYTDEDGLVKHQVGCSHYPSCIGECYAFGDTKEEAIELWNTRPSLWHTGIPTEEGWYLVQTPAGWVVVQYDKIIGWVKFKDKAYIKKWQKIEED